MGEGMVSVEGERLLREDRPVVPQIAVAWGPREV